MIAKILDSLLSRPKPDIYNINFPDVTGKKDTFRQVLLKNQPPFFVIDWEIVLNRFHRFSRALTSSWGDNFNIAYSFKTNYELAASKILKRQDVLAEVVSGYEYTLAKKAGYSGNQIIFNGPVKRNEDLYRAFYDGALVHIDNADELMRAIEISKKSKKKISVGIRINTSSTGIESRFGFSPEKGEVQRALDSIKKSNKLILTGLHIHVGSDVSDPAIYKKAIQPLVKVLYDAKKMNFCLKHVDIGGGFPGHGRKPYQYESWHPLDIEGYIQIIVHELLTSLEHNKYRLIIEPGRCLIDDAGVFFTKVYSRKIVNGVLHVLTDGAITMLPLVYYRPQIVRVYTSHFEEKTGKTRNAVVFGGTCKEDDVLFRGELPESLATGDCIVYFCVGAYNQSMGSELIFSKPKTIFL